MNLLIATLAMASTSCPPATEASVRAAFADWLVAYRSRDLATAFASWREFVGNASEPRAENRAADVLARGEGCRWRIVRSLNYPVRPP